MNLSYSYPFCGGDHAPIEQSRAREHLRGCFFSSLAGEEKGREKYEGVRGWGKDRGPRPLAPFMGRSAVETRLTPPATYSFLAGEKKQ